MADVIFYEKPGCANNARQKLLLEKAGHRLEVRNLLEEAWTAEALRSYFGDKPSAEWFNKAAPRVKSGEVDPTRLTAEEALALMLAEPILIRRPLIEALGRRAAGFDPAAIDHWIGLAEGTARDHDEVGSNRSDFTNGVESKNSELDAGGKPAQRSTLPRPALALDLETCRRSSPAKAAVADESASP